MSQPLKTNKKDSGPGRPEIADDQYWDWLNEMRPFLEDGSSLWYAIDKCGLNKHAFVIYEKYRENGEFSQKINKLQGLIGEYANLIAAKTLKRIHTRVVETNGDYPMTREEMQVWKTVAEKHRTAQPFFVNRTEEADAKEEDFGKVVDRVPKIEYIVPKDEKSDDNKSDSKASDQTQSNPEATPSVETPNGSDN